MPEGDTVWRTAHRLDEALAGRVVTGFDVRVPDHATVDLSGQTVEDVRSRGKHLLMHVGTTTVHSHLKMEGAWHLYRTGDRWTRPAHQARIVVTTDRWQAVGFSLGVLDLVDRAQEEDAVGYLGPDLLGPTWDAAEAVRRVSADPRRPVGLALLDQRNLAGIGNLYRCEVCFVHGVHPETPVAAVDVAAMVRTAFRMLRSNRDRNQQTTTGDTRRGRQNWVHRRDGQDCRRCGTAIATGMLGDDPTSERWLWFCPSCQPRPGTPSGS